MDYPIQKKIILIAISVFNIAISPVYGYNDFKFSVEQPELTVGLKETQLLNQKKYTALSNIAMQIQSKGAKDLTEFTRVSLNEMSSSYREESIRARHERLPGEKKRQKLYRWSYSTLEYAHYLQKISDSIDDETQIILNVGNTGELLFIINGLPLIVNGPLINRPDILEKSIINTFCSFKNCDLEYPLVQREPIKKSINIKAEWRMDEKNKPEYVTNDGLHFIFSNIKNRSHKQELCLNIIKELRLIVYALKEASDKGIFVDWNSINIELDAKDSNSRLVINDFGDALTLNLIELSKVPELTKLTLSWIKAMVEKKSYQQYLYADELFISAEHNRLIN